jgi:hypothetical protein
MYYLVMGVAVVCVSSLILTKTHQNKKKLEETTHFVKHFLSECATGPKKLGHETQKISAKIGKEIQRLHETIREPSGGHTTKTHRRLG